MSDSQQEPFVVMSGAGAPAVNLSVIRGNFRENIDLRLITIVFLSLFLHTAGILYLRHIPLPPKKAAKIEEVPQRFAKFIIDKPIIKKEIKAQTKAGGPAAQAEKPKAAEPEAPAPGGGAAGGKASEARIAQAKVAVSRRAQVVESKLRNAGVLGVLAGLGGTSRGPAVRDVLGASGRFKGSTDLDQALEGFSGLSVGANAMNQELVRSRDGAGTKDKGDITDLISGLSSAWSVSATKVGNIVYKPPEIIGEASNSVKRAGDAISLVVKRNLPSVKLSYERQLKKNPQLSGKLTIRFIINEDGSVSNVEVVESNMDSPELETDILRKIQRWQFEAIPAGSGSTTVTYPFVFQPT